MNQQHNFESPLKSSLQQKPIFFLLVLLLLLLIFNLLAALFIHYISIAMGYDYKEVTQNLSNNNNTDIRHFIRLANITSQIHTFLLPAIAITVLAYAWQWRQTLRLHQIPSITNMVLAIFFYDGCFSIGTMVLLHQ